VDAVARATRHCRHPGAGRDPSARKHITPVLGSARLGGERGTFCFGKKYPKTIAPEAVISTTSCCLDCPCRLPIAHRRETTRHIPVARPSLTLRAAFGVQIGSPCRFSPASLQSDMRALLARSSARLRHRQRRPYRSAAGHPWPRAKQDQTASLDMAARRRRASRGPSNTASGRRISPKDGPQDAGQFAVGTWMYRRRTPATASKPVVHGWTKGVFAGSPFSW